MINNINILVYWRLPMHKASVKHKVELNYVLKC